MYSRTRIRKLIENVKELKEEEIELKDKIKAVEDKQKEIEEIGIKNKGDLWQINQT